VTSRGERRFAMRQLREGRGAVFNLPLSGSTVEGWACLLTIKTPIGKYPRRE
jgi:hypothetical protein